MKRLLYHKKRDWQKIKFMFFKTNKLSKYSHVADIKSCKSDGINIAKNVSIKLSKKKTRDFKM